MKSNKINKTGKEKDINKKPYITGLYDKPVIEVADAGVPLSLKSCPNITDDTPTLVDNEHYGKVYKVSNSSAYTIRLGIHSSPVGVGVMNEDTAVACAIPTTTDDVHKITALFFIPDLYPAKYMDAIWLQAEKPFHIEFVMGSAILECNNDSRGLALRHEALTEEDGLILIMQDGLDGEIPTSCTFSYDFIKFQIKVVFEE